MRGLACKEHLSAWRSEKFKSSGRDRTSKLEASLEWKHDAAFECARIGVSLQITLGRVPLTIEEKSLLERKRFDDADDENVSVACVNSWLLSIFVKVFD